MFVEREVSTDLLQVFGVGHRVIVAPFETSLGRFPHGGEMPPRQPAGRRRYSVFQTAGLRADRSPWKARLIGGMAR